MWIVFLALRRPLTFLVAALLLLLVTPFVLMRTPRGKPGFSEISALDSLRITKGTNPCPAITSSTHRRIADVTLLAKVAKEFRRALPDKSHPIPKTNRDSHLTAGFRQKA
jgi:hypothetical protein